MSTTLTKKVMDGVALITLAECVYVGDGTSETLKDRLNTLEGTVTTNKTTYKKWVTIGDSLTFGGWGNEANKVLNINEYINLAVSGTTIHGSNGMITQAKRVDSDTDLVVIMGGTNDMGWFNGMHATKDKGTFGEKTTGTFIGSYQLIIETLLEKNNKMKIILITPPRAFDSDRSFLATIGDWVKEVAQFYGLPCIDAYNCLGINDFNKHSFHSDLLHYNAEGNKRLGKTFANQIMSL